MGLFGGKKKVSLEEISEIAVRHAIDRSRRIEAGTQCLLSKDDFLRWETGALVLQSYAGQVSIVAFAFKHDPKGKKELISSLSRHYFDSWSNALDHLEDPPESFSKVEILLLADQHRAEYDRIVAEGPSMQLAGYEHSRRVGIRFANLVADGNSLASEYGQRLFQNCVESCVGELAGYSV